MNFPDEYYFEEGCFISEWMNVPEDEAVSIARARVAPGGTTRWHALAGVTERYLILEGQGRAEIGEHQQNLTVGDCICIPPGERQRIINTGPTDLIFLAICTPRFTRNCYRAIEDSDSDSG